MPVPIRLTALLWLAPAALTAQTSLQHVQVQVDAANTIWTSTGIAVTPGDVVVVHAHGTVRIGPYVDEVDADGAGANLQHVGTLELKIGPHPGQRVGVLGAVVAEHPGTVRLRVYDARHDDNAGHFTVNVLYVPAAVIPSPAPVDR